MEAEQAFIELMDATEEYYKLTQDLSQTVKQGLFHISQARYSYHGPLGRTQYHAEMEACTRVQVEELDFQLVSALPVVLSQCLPAAPCDTHLPSRPAHSSSTQGSVTAGGASSQHTRAQQEVDSGLGASDWGGSGGGDPLKWFGVLLPQPLREAQKDFAKGVAHVVRLACAKQRLQRALDRAQDLGLGSQTLD